MDSISDEEQEKLNYSAADFVDDGFEENCDEDNETRDTDVLIASSNSRENGSQIPPQTKVYKSRYWVLLLYSLILFFQALVWNTFGPITESVMFAYKDWTPRTIAALSSWGSSGIFLFVLPAGWCIQKYGLRPVMLPLLTLWVIGHALRCITTQSEYFLITAHICGAFNGILATTIMASAMIPALWFPAEQRVTATAFANVINQMGAGISFLEPLIVRSPSNTTSVEDIRGDIHRLMLIDLGVAGGLFLCTLIYFPSKPPLPPTPSSTVPRHTFFSGFSTVSKSFSFWLYAVALAIFVPISSNWISVISFSLQEFGLDQNEIGWLGIYISVAMVIASILSARLADLFYGRLKLGLLVLMLLSSLSYLWFMLMSLNIITKTKVQAYISVLAGQSINFATLPFFMELMCESVYPAPESVIGVVSVFLENFVGFLFLCLFFVPSIESSDPVWMTYVLVGSNFGMMLPVLFAEERYHRSTLDRSNLHPTL